LRVKVRVTRVGTTRTGVVGRAPFLEAAVGGWPSATNERLPSLAEWRARRGRGRSPIGRSITHSSLTARYANSPRSTRLRVAFNPSKGPANANSS